VLRITDHLDRVASSLESKGFFKEAEALDIVSNTIERLAYKEKPYSMILDAFSDTLPRDLERVSKMHPSLKKYENEYLKLTDTSGRSGWSPRHVKTIDIAKYLSRIQNDVKAILDSEYGRADKIKGADVTGLRTRARLLREFDEDLTDLINACASEIRRNGVESTHAIGSGPSAEEFKKKKRQREVSEGSSQRFRMQTYSLPKVKNYMGPSDGTVELIELVNPMSKSWYEHWHGFVIRLFSHNNVALFVAHDEGAEELHGGYNVTGAHIITGKRILQQLEDAGYDVSFKGANLDDVPKLSNPSYKLDQASFTGDNIGSKDKLPEKAELEEALP